MQYIIFGIRLMLALVMLNGWYWMMKDEKYPIFRKVMLVVSVLLILNL